ncbi:copper amine oxidase [Stereum hirsutum FP-91666 SS1]|uniref:copper amine oxidase n=1 Tax=Stereum hirsutum (strain FP-91666) TaxID=721885 RepID=UPI0004449702|nr:copper amine oxidase [Stereum hirsutum FP-91666 SS1]EIM84675.1 copper amine oxidase [Stereum hirsutum FP-91666 SS1]
MRSLSLLACISAFLLASSDVVDAKVSRVRHPKMKRPHHQARAIGAYNDLARELTSRSSGSASSSGWDSKAPKTTAPKSNVWKALSNDEAAGVIELLHAQDWLNLTSAEDAGTWDNTISVVETLTPNKTDVLPFLTAGAEAPERWSRVIIMFAATEEPYLQDFQVGPLPVTNDTTITPLDWYSTKGQSIQRNYDADSDLVYEFITNATETVQDILDDLLDGVDFGDDDADIDIWGVDPLQHSYGRVIQWVTIWQTPSTVFDGETLMPEGIYFQVDQTGRDPADWAVLGWFYDNIYYNSTQAFRDAWEAGELSRNVINKQGDWIGSDWTGEKMEFDEKAPPVMVQPGGDEGLRYKVDVEEQYVEWMDFSFYIAFSRDTGMTLFDIKYKGERIIYELGLQEAIAHYAGHDPAQSGVAYLDTYYGFGPYAFELLSGYDCPTYATYLNSTFHVDELSKTHRNSICLFEADMPYLIQRHASMNYVSASKNIAFIVRSVSTVGNYDYNFDYTFYLDGTVETTVRASGYIQSAHYKNNEDYGYQIHDGLSGSMHDHCLTFKADIDIVGTANTLAKHAVVPVSVEYPWSNGTVRNTMKLERSYVESEDEGKLMWPTNSQAMYVVVNKNETNKYGEPRGYRIMPSLGGGMHLTITNSTNLLNSQSFATHQLYVTKQKDTEPKAAHANNNYDVANPIVEFDKFFDGESLDQEDIVLWFNLGMHHVPHTGDLPNTVFTTAQSSMQIMPHNYLLGDPSRNSRQTVRLDYSNDDGVTDVKTFGAHFAKGTANLSATTPDFYAYQGDVAVRKFPYDPQDPFNDTESIV